MRNTAALVLSAALAVAVASGCESDKSSRPTERTYQDTVIDQQVQTVTATVEAVDQSSRTVTLRGEGGNLLSFRAGPEVRNLAQLQKGDKVNVNYYEATMGRLLRPGETPPTEAQDLTVRAPEGEKPGFATRRTVTRTARIEAIDPNYPSVTLKGDDGVTTTVKVRDKSRLNEIKVGDRVAITYAEGVAIAVEEAD
jgi:Cu/Ag efflux protein CusF